MTQKLNLEENLEAVLHNWKRALEKGENNRELKGQYIRFTTFLIREGYRVPREYFEFYLKLSRGGK